MASGLNAESAIALGTWLNAASISGGGFSGPPQSISPSLWRVVRVERHRLRHPRRSARHKGRVRNVCNATPAGGSPSPFVRIYCRQISLFMAPDSSVKSGVGEKGEYDATISNQFASVPPEHSHGRHPLRSKYHRCRSSCRNSGLLAVRLPEMDQPPPDTTLLHSILARAAKREVCALVDAETPSARQRLPLPGPRSIVSLGALSAQCDTLKTADLLIRAAASVWSFWIWAIRRWPPRIISLTSWFGCAAPGGTPAVSSRWRSGLRTCASLLIECCRAKAVWSGASGVSRLLRTANFKSDPHKRGCNQPVFTAKAI